ncbi:hypothetical protein [Paractinoplanes brasiliensis]|uniref:Uncharacterized protein n=1 Tax=Paractinoplanes brasiliensis TaxID=52695 RepID=A0A4R6JLN5_9ACTN|nr:hypothetical protein [Actinoplanes brasiliensis]TDO37210.1 hypothetical protein C8E87_0818 [Actinoplanes brasiliensis]GID32872.1 hypothetical protein Abr02nite_78550 [Actinoplanes brasiliensis]
MPEEPFDDRMTPPADPWATINRPAPTVHLDGTDLDQTTRITPAASRGGPTHVDPAGSRDGATHIDPAAHPGDPNQTVHFAPATPTVHDPRSAPTVRQPPPGIGYQPQSQGIGQSPSPDQRAHGEPGAYGPQPGATVRLGGPNQTARFTPSAPAPHDPQPAPTVHQPQSAWHDQGPQPAWHDQRPQPEAARGRQPAPAPGSQPAPTVRVEAELRFGPGVPATPSAAPDWPTPAPAGRPLWRRLVSVLSTLLTIVLIAVVGLYLWQRLRPLELESVTVAVPQPAGERCDVTVDVVATVRTNGRSGVIRYQWFRSDAPPGDVLTEQVGRGRSTATLTLRWTFSGVGSTTETATVNIIEPTPIRSGAEVAYRCTG